LTDQSTLLTSAQTLASLADYLAQLALNPDLAQTTIQKYTHDLNSFQQFLAGTPVSATAARTFLAQLRQNNYSYSSVNSYYHAIKPFLEFLGIPLKVKFRKRHHLPPYHAPEHLAAIFAAINNRTDTWSKLSQRDSLIILTLAFTGLRRSELLNLRASDLSNNRIFVRSGKGDKDRVVPTPPNVAESLRTYIKDLQINPTDRIFPLSQTRLYRIVKEASTRAGINDISPHSLRHYYATRLVEQGAPLRSVQELMGHASLDTTAIYINLTAKHLDDTASLLTPEAQSISISISNPPIQNKNKCKRLSLSLSLSNEQNGKVQRREGRPCGLKSTKGRPSTPHSTSHQSRPLSNTGPEPGQKYASARDAPTVPQGYQNAGATRQNSLSTESQEIGSSENKP
jgi:integrase/recombinase XerD